MQTPLVQHISVARAKKSSMSGKSPHVPLMQGPCVTVHVVTAGPMGPNAKLFGVGVAAFLAGWGLVKVGSQK